MDAKTAGILAAYAVGGYLLYTSGPQYGARTPGTAPAQAAPARTLGTAPAQAAGAPLCPTGYAYDPVVNQCGLIVGGAHGGGGTCPAGYTVDAIGLNCILATSDVTHTPSIRPHTGTVVAPPTSCPAGTSVYCETLAATGTGLGGTFCYCQ